MNKKLIVFVIVGLAGFYTMQKGFDTAKGKALVEEPVGWFVALGIAGFLIAATAIILFIYERNRDKSYDPDKTFVKAHQDNAKPVPKILHAYSEDQKRDLNKEKAK